MDEIVYAVDYNDKRERHLNATVLESLGRPSILITDAYNAHMQNIYKTHRKPDSAIIGNY
jgi:Cft2 family RNA processing exonuclease